MHCELIKICRCIILVLIGLKSRGLGGYPLFSAQRMKPIEGGLSVMKQKEFRGVGGYPLFPTPYEVYIIINECLSTFTKKEEAC